jgi:hypothetical protein
VETNFDLKRGGVGVKVNSMQLFRNMLNWQSLKFAAQLAFFLFIYMILYVFIYFYLLPVTIYKNNKDDIFWPYYGMFLWIGLYLSPVIFNLLYFLSYKFKYNYLITIIFTIFFIYPASFFLSIVLSYIGNLIR